MKTILVFCDHCLDPYMTRGISFDAVASNMRSRTSRFRHGNKFFRIVTFSAWYCSVLGTSVLFIQVDKISSPKISSYLNSVIAHMTLIRHFSSFLRLPQLLNTRIYFAGNTSWLQDTYSQGVWFYRLLHRHAANYIVSPS